MAFGVQIRHHVRNLPHHSKFHPRQHIDVFRKEVKAGLTQSITAFFADGNYRKVSLLIRAEEFVGFAQNIGIERAREPALAGQDQREHSFFRPAREQRMPRLRDAADRRMQHAH